MAYLTLKQLAEKHGVSRQRIVQILNARPELKKRMLKVDNSRQRPFFWLLPEDILGDYAPDESWQQYGKRKKRGKSQID